ncbi:MAG: ABC transporter substrate-binding protein [Thermodesulfobacteriota bacterium]
MRKMSYLLLSVSFLVLAFFPAPSAGLEKFKVAVSVKANPSYMLPFWAAEEKGFWKKNGLDAEFIPFNSGRSLFQAMAGGAIDAGLGGAISDVRAIASGVPAIIVADLHSPQEFSVYVRSDSRIKGPQDLRGAKIGVSRFGGLVHAFGLALAKALNMENQIKFMASGGAGKEIAALKAGATDGTIFSFFGMAPLIFRGQIRAAVSMRDYLPKEWIDVTISARKGFTQTGSRTLRAGLKTIIEGAVSVMEDRAWTVSKLKKEYGYSDKAANLIHRKYLRYGRSGVISKQGIENLRGFLIDNGVLPERKIPPAEKLFTNEFVS